MGRGRHSEPITCNAEDYEALHNLSLLEDNKQLVLRAKLVIDCIEGNTITDIAEKYSVQQETVSYWKRRFATEGPNGLLNRPRGWNGSIYGPDFNEKLAQTFHSDPPEGASGWTVKLLSSQMHVSTSVIHRHLKKVGLLLPQRKHQKSDSREKINSIKDQNKESSVSDSGNTSSSEPVLLQQEDTCNQHSDTYDTQGDMNRLGIDIRIRTYDKNKKITNQCDIDIPFAVKDAISFDMDSIAGFRHDFAEYEDALTSGINRVCESFSNELLSDFSKKKKSLIPIAPMGVLTCSASFGDFPFTATGDMVKENSQCGILRSMRQEEIELTLTSLPGGTYRMVSKTLHLTQNRTDASAVKSRTLQDFITRTGSTMQESLLRQADEILARNGFDTETLLPLDGGKLQIQLPDNDGDPEWREYLRKVIDAYNEGKTSDFQIKDKYIERQIQENPENILIIRPDAISVKRMHKKTKDPATRKHGMHQESCLDRKNGGIGGSNTSGNETATVQNIVIHVQRGLKTFIITATNNHDAYKLLLAFLLENGLKEGIPLLFFADGASDIKKAVSDYFSFYPHQLLLDWYHLTKKMKERISSTFFGTSKEKKEILRHVNAILWAGNADDAISYFDNIDSKLIRNQSTYDKMISYLERNRGGIYSYALRKELGYANASSSVEKANEIIVAQRQKHNGMSWSYPGSGALAVISAMRRNGGLQDWVSKRSVSLAFAP